MNPCIICLEQVNELQWFPKYNFNCVCKYTTHESCFTKWTNQSHRCIICKQPVSKRQTYIQRFLVQPLLKTGFLVVLIVYISVLNVAYILNTFTNNESFHIKCIQDYLISGVYDYENI